MAETKITTAELIVIGGSSGSLEVILELLPRLGAGYRIPLLIVMHRNNATDSVLRDLLERKSALPVVEIEEKDTIREGRVYLVPGDYHVLIETDRTFSLDYSEKVNYSRPSIDVTMTSAAAVFKENLIGILLSGANDDGVLGMQQIKEKGGYCIVQDPQEAVMDQMPREALRRNKIDEVLSVPAMASFLSGLRRD
jgi:two-component system, chemotaxis family, protein-glutamate methylesterase/glutaminase